MIQGLWFNPEVLLCIFIPCLCVFPLGSLFFPDKESRYIAHMCECLCFACDRVGKFSCLPLVLPEKVVCDLNEIMLYLFNLGN